MNRPDLADLKVPVDMRMDDDRLTAIRQALPGQRALMAQQAAAERHEIAAAAFGLLMSVRAIHQRVARRGPFRRGRLIAVGILGGLALTLSVLLLAVIVPHLPAQATPAGKGPTEWEVLCAFGVIGLLGVAIAAIVNTVMLFTDRNAQWWSVDLYPRLIPDAALLKWEAAQASGHFVAFSVVEPVLEQRPTKDPWLIGHLEIRKGDPLEDRAKSSIVLAYWD